MTLDHQQTFVVLDKAVEILRQGWCQGEAAEDARGIDLAPWSRLAVSWCASGAVQRAVVEVLPPSSRVAQTVDWWLLHGQATRDVMLVLNEVTDERITALDDEILDSLVLYNDDPERTVDEVIEVFEEAKARVREELERQGLVSAP